VVNNRILVQNCLGEGFWVWFAVKVNGIAESFIKNIGKVSLIQYKFFLFCINYTWKWLGKF
jgi:hypothetical protein